MPTIVADCPRCGAKRMTFDVREGVATGEEYNWKHWYELFSICRNCFRPTIFSVSQKEISHAKFVGDIGSVLKITASLNTVFSVERYISLKEHITKKPPEHVPELIRKAFLEGATCAAVGCWNAAAAMFRLCIDLATRPLLPDGEVEGLNSKVRRDLGLRLPWRFQHKLLPKDLSELSSCIREDGNDGAHAGTLAAADAEDLLDFTEALLERLYAEPERLKMAEVRRQERRKELS